MTGKQILAACTLLVAAPLAVLSCASAGTRVFVNPDADMAFYERVAVLPFTNLTSDGMAGPRLTRAFVTELIMTNRYQIVQTEEFRPILMKAGGMPAPDGSYDVVKLRDAATQVGATGILRGAVTEYQMQASGSGETPVLSFDVEMLDAKTGDVVWRGSITKRGRGRIPIFGGGTRTLGHLTQVSCKELVAKLRKGAL